MLLTKSKIRELRRLASQIKPKIGQERWAPSHSNRIVMENTAYVTAHAHKGVNGESQREVAEGIVLAHNHIHEFMWAFLELTGGQE